LYKYSFIYKQSSSTTGQHSSSSVVFKQKQIADPRTDFAFKKLFGKKELLIDFIQSTLPEKHIQDVEYLPTNLTPELASQKLGIVDVLCKDEDGSSYIVEMQRAWHQGFDKCAQFYSSRLYSSQLDEKYTKLAPVIFIAVADFVLFPKKRAHMSVHVMHDIVTHENDLKDFTYVFLELPKYKPHQDEFHEIGRWCELLNHGHEDVEVEASDSIMLTAYETLEMANWSKDELNLYKASQDVWRDGQAILDGAFEKGLEKGIEKGMEKGIDEGLLQAARNMKNQDFSIDQISRSTGVTAEKIAKL
jgi:predicted transposase/invertase (TIGR01784 family)